MQRMIAPRRQDIHVSTTELEKAYCKNVEMTLWRSAGSTKKYASRPARERDFELLQYLPSERAENQAFKITFCERPFVEVLQSIRNEFSTLGACLGPWGAEKHKKNKSNGSPAKHIVFGGRGVGWPSSQAVVVMKLTLN